jgi:outer membrane protein TolC
LALEVSQTQAQVAATEVTLTQAQSDVRDGRHMLAFLIGVEEVDGPLSDDFSLPGNIPPVDDFRAQAAAGRQDLLAAAAAVGAARSAVDAAIAEYYPSASLNVSGFLYREYFSQASKWDAMLIGNLPIFSAGIIQADVRDAFSRLRQAALYQHELKRQIDRDVQIAYDNLVTSQAQLRNLKEEVKASNDAYQQSVHLLHNGLAINLDVLTAQDQLLNSQLTYANEDFSRTLNYLDLLRIIGRLNPRTPQEERASTQPSTRATAATN